MSDDFQNPLMKLSLPKENQEAVKLTLNRDLTVL